MVTGSGGTAQAKARGSRSERGKGWDCHARLPRRLRFRQVIAVNKTGEGTPSNTVMAVL